VCEEQTTRMPHPYDAKIGFIRIFLRLSLFIKEAQCVITGKAEMGSFIFKLLEER
jgi:hypothetical protein